MRDTLAIYNRSLANRGNPAPVPRALPVSTPGMPTYVSVAPVRQSTNELSIPAARSLPVKTPGIPTPGIPTPDPVLVRTVPPAAHVDVTAAKADVDPSHAAQAQVQADKADVPPPVCADITDAVCPDEAAGTSAIVRVDFWRATGELSESYEVKLSAHPETSEHTGFGQGLYAAIGDWTLKYARSATSEALEGGIVEVKLERGQSADGVSYTSADGHVTVTVLDGKDPLEVSRWWIVGVVAGILTVIAIAGLLFCSGFKKTKGSRGSRGSLAAKKKDAFVLVRPSLWGW
jgi:hypothetical protein